MKPIYIVQVYRRVPGIGWMGSDGSRLIEARRVSREEWARAISKGATQESVDRYHYARLTECAS